MNEYHPLRSLREGQWFKLICGASFQHLPAVRNLTLAYTLAGADCIDVAADPAVVAATRDALSVARELASQAQQRGFRNAIASGCKPLLMVSLNDGEDPHFRKAQFDPTQCPKDCPRPCEQICPAAAIAFSDTSNVPISGVIDRRCYGCGRCIPVCPQQLIITRSYLSTPQAIAPLLLEMGIEAIEIHTQVGHHDNFQRLWQEIKPFIDQLQLVAISCPDGVDLIDYLRSLAEIIQPLPCPLIWQTDGRPMSGDIGTGTTRATIKLAQKVLAARLPGYVQLAGGTNHHTIAKLKASGLLKTYRFSTKNKDFEYPQLAVAGIAYGSYARVLLSPLIDQLETMLEQNSRPPRLESVPELLWQAVTVAHSLVSQLKPPMKVSQPSSL